MKFLEPFHLGLRTRLKAFDRNILGAKHFGERLQLGV